jgi:enediyne biosynthesis protein E4
LRVKLRGRGGNTDAIGAIVILKAGGVTQTRMVRTGSSYLSQSELVQTFGLGERTVVDSVTVRWPNGQLTSVASPPIRQTMVIEEELKGAPTQHGRP